MTLDELRQAVEALPAGASVTLTVAELREALHENGAADHVPNSGSRPDRLLTARDAADRLGASVRYVYAHRGDFPFTRQLPGGAIRFSEAGLTAWLRRTALDGTLPRP